MIQCFLDMIQTQAQNKVFLHFINPTCGMVYYYPYRAFGGQNKIVYSTRFVTRKAIFLNIAQTLCDKSFNIDLRLRYVVRIHSSENRTIHHPP